MDDQESPAWPTGEDPEKLVQSAHAEGMCKVPHGAYLTKLGSS